MVVYFPKVPSYSTKQIHKSSWTFDDLTSNLANVDFLPFYKTNVCSNDVYQRGVSFVCCETTRNQLPNGYTPVDAIIFAIAAEIPVATIGETFHFCHISWLLIRSNKGNNNAI